MKKYILIFCFFISFNLQAAWLGTWAHRVEITVSNTNIDSDVTHFPLLLTLGTSVGTGNDDISFIFDELINDANRKKIAITKSDGTTQVYCEIEKWDDANEDAWLWVAKSDLTLTAASTTTLYLYYDSAKAENTTYVEDGNTATAENVWDSNYVMVQHLNESDIDGGIGDIKDSSTEDNDGTTSGMDGSDDVSAKIGIGFDFDGIDDYIECGTGGDLGTENGYTINLWYNPNVDTDNWNGIIMRIDDYNFYVLRVNGEDEIRHGFFDNADNAHEDDTSYDFVPGNWYMITSIYDYSAGTLKIYINGTENSSNTPGIFTRRYNSEKIVNIGRYSSGTAYTINAKLDEIRTAITARTADWVKAIYYSEIDGLINWGSEESLATGSQIIIVN